MNPIVLKVVKTVVEVGSVALPMALKYFKDKELDENIEKKVAKAVADAMKNQVKGS